jgi:hypothetical protein
VFDVLDLPTKRSKSNPVNSQKRNDFEGKEVIGWELGTEFATTPSRRREGHNSQVAAGEQVGGCMAHSQFARRPKFVHKFRTKACGISVSAGLRVAQDPKRVKT